MGCQDKRICGIRLGVAMTVATIVLAVTIVVITIAIILSKDQTIESGLMFEPRLDANGIFYKSSSFSAGKPTNEIIDRMKTVMTHYDLRERNKSRIWDCNPDTHPNISDNAFCLFGKDYVNEECSEELNFGYGDKPCIFLLYKEVNDWIPEPYRSLDELPEDMPADLQNHIAEVTASNDGNVPEILWIHCNGEYPADREVLGTIRYHTPWNGWHGIPVYYFPYRNDPDYMAPILSIQLDQPESDVLIHLECSAWARNLIPSKEDGTGMITIELARLEGKKRRR